MRGGLSGFYIFIACIALGTAAIAGVNSISQSITAAINEEGRTILGGDIRFELQNRPASEDEQTHLAQLGAMTSTAGLRSMARLPDGSDQTLVEVKAVEANYPLYGALETTPQLSSTDLFDQVDGYYGVAVAPLLLDRLGLARGDQLLLGNAAFDIRAVIDLEPDAFSDGFGFAPRLMLSQDGLDAAGLIRTGSLVEYGYKISLGDAATEADIEAVRIATESAFPEAGWSVRSRSNAAPSLTANIVRFSQFLTLVGLTALIVGGVGVANAVRAYLDAKRGVIATFKCLGASGEFVFSVYLIQMLMVASIGIVIGLVLGALMPIAAQAFLSGILPVSSDVTLYPGALLLAALFGVMTALAFALLPLGRARNVPATALFREQGFDASGLPARRYIIAALLLVLMIAGLAIYTSYDRFIATVFMGGIVFAFILLRLVSTLIEMLARRAPSVRSTPLRLAIGNIHRPGALTPSVVLSLGLGLALLVTLALIDGNLRREISGALPEQAPNFFFVDIQSSEVEAFTTLVEQEAPGGSLSKVPMLRGRIVAFNGVDVREMEVPPGGEWVLRGDRGVTYSDTVPENSVLTAGEWWPENYSGEPLVSFSAEEAGELGVGVGDAVTVNVLGRNITARIASLRELEWESLSINFVMVFSPNTFAGAPHAWLATLNDPEAAPADESRILRAVTNAFPTVTSVRVKDALDVINRLMGQLAAAIRAAAGVALITSVLVLAGALAAGNRARAHDAVVLKTLGATRRTLIRAFSYEYMLIGLATAIFALVAGGIAAWFIVARIMTLRSEFLPDVAVATIVIALVLTVGIGLIGTWRVLGQKAAPVLRNL
ncbi:ABC transporter permease [Hoeflea sp. WL0058]|uniref:ABC transporter permease n=1 Tax=Flavimaribacter sediminis TaxID=2865987 RepID=A0AAE2ZL43_9HYPH|nr:ABC transporter permease [Flavimaribacter sediminis]MBW8638523.1 ABC transporter permease [Flavimaribacter sediminis]